MLVDCVFKSTAASGRDYTGPESCTIKLLVHTHTCTCMFLYTVVIQPASHHSYHADFALYVSMTSVCLTTT